MTDGGRDEGGGDAIGPVAMAAMLALIAAAGAATSRAMPINGDVAWYLVMAARVLDGARPYVDVIEPNPPLIVYLNMIVVAAARAAGVASARVFEGAVLGLVAASLAIAWRLGTSMPRAVRQVAILAGAYAMLVQVGPMFGQREHLLIILILPYAVAASARAGGRRVPGGLDLVAGLMAGVGFALKPFFVPAWLAVELHLAMRRGVRAWRRPGAVAVLAVLVIYAASVPVVAPGFFEAAREWLPLYRHHQPYGPQIVSGSWRLGMVTGAIVAARLAAGPVARDWVEVLGILAGTLAMAVYPGGKGWMYHWYPSLACSVVATASAAAAMGIRRPGPSRGGAVLGRRLVVGTTLVVLAGLVSWLGSVPASDPEAEGLVRDLAGRGEPVLVLSNTNTATFPMLVEAGASWPMRHPNLWPIAAFYAGEPWSPGSYHESGAMPDAERRFISQVAEDFERSRPVLLMVDRASPTPGLVGFDALAYFLRDPAFRRAFASYEPMAETARFRVFARPRTVSTGSRMAPRPPHR